MFFQVVSDEFTLLGNQVNVFKSDVCVLDEKCRLNAFSINLLLPAKYRQR